MGSLYFFFASGRWWVCHCAQPWEVGADPISSGLPSLFTMAPRLWSAVPSPPSRDATGAEAAVPGGGSLESDGPTQFAAQQQSGDTVSQGANPPNFHAT